MSETSRARLLNALYPAEQPDTEQPLSPLRGNTRRLKLVPRKPAQPLEERPTGHYERITQRFSAVDQREPGPNQEEKPINMIEREKEVLDVLLSLQSSINAAGDMANPEDHDTIILNLSHVLNRNFGRIPEVIPAISVLNQTIDQFSDAKGTTKKETLMKLSSALNKAITELMN